jgi:hypothetical protein
MKIAFTNLRRNYTKSFDRYVQELSCSMTIRDEALCLSVHWDPVA